MLPLIAIGGVAKALRSPIAKKAGKAIGKLFKRNKKGSNQGAAAQMTESPVSYTMTANKMENAIVSDEQGGFNVADKINDFLGRSTKDARQVNVTTGVDKNLLVGLGVGALVLWLLFKK